MFLGGGVVIKLGDEIIGASGAPGASLMTTAHMPGEIRFGIG